MDALEVVADRNAAIGRLRVSARAGVSSFGFGGTNAHVVVEQGPDLSPVGVSSGSPVCTVVVSGKSVARVGSWAGVLAEWMDGGGADVRWRMWRMR